MKISAAVLATVVHGQENWDICPSDHTNNKGGCYTQDIGWIDGSSNVKCTMTNEDCMSVTCSAETITADLRADLFHTNSKNQETFMKQLQDGHRTLERTDNPGVALVEGELCGFEVTATGVKLNAWPYDDCNVAPTMNAQGDIVYTVSVISKGNAPDIPTIEFYVDTKVEASCKYPSKVVVDADGFWINQEDVQAAEENAGNLASTIECKFYEDAQYQNPIGSNHLINMGKTIYGRVESTALAGLSYDLVGVTVTNANDLAMSFPVIANGVPDTMVNAQSDGSAETGQNVNFSYWSFGFETATGTDQNELKIQCEVNLKITDGENKDDEEETVEFTKPDGYEVYDTEWGTVYTKLYSDKVRTFESGQALCTNDAIDGTVPHMPIPQDLKQNQFYFDIAAQAGKDNDADLWLGISRYGPDGLDESGNSYL